MSNKIWPVDSFGESIGSLAWKAAPLLLHPDSWVHRRKETIDFLDAGRLRRRVSVDFTLPNEDQLVLRVGGPTSQVLVPLGMLEKAPLQGFSVMDESGRALPVLTRDENGRLSQEMLIAVAQGLLPQGEVLDSDIERDLIVIATCDVDEATRAYRRISQQTGGARQQRTALWSHELFAFLVEALTKNFILLVAIDAEAGQRRIIKFEYETRFERTRQTRGAIARLFGWGALPLGLPTPSASHAASYHLEVVSPPGVLIKAADLRLPEGGEVLTRSVGGERVHLFGSFRGAERSFALLTLMQSPSAPLFTAFTVAMATAVLLICAALSLPTSVAAGPQEAIAALFLAVPALFIATVFRPGQHELALALFRGMHVLIGYVAVVSFLAAIIVVFEVGGEAFRGCAFMTMGTLSVVAAAIAGVAFFAARSGR